jgi:hypothetical protein
MGEWENENGRRGVKENMKQKKPPEATRRGF